LTRRALRKLVLRELGLNADTPRAFAGQVMATGRENELMAHPERVVDAYPTQNPFGVPWFVPGLSDPNGNDVL
jgi:hypothetical protein